MAGAVLVMARPGGHKDSEYLLGIIKDEEITTIHFVPSMLGIFLEERVEDAKSLRRVICSGEALSREIEYRLRDRTRAQVSNLYGPTEAAIDVTYWISEGDGEREVVPIGKPIANIQMYVLDPEFEPVPIGVRGEIFISGVGLARGYLGSPELTGEKFIPNRFGENGERLYRTGDVGRYLSDGNIEYVGRTDNQVKLRGYRIELGEIEAALNEHRSVKQSVVVASKDERGRKRLQGYVVAEGVTSTELKKHIRERLPEYMVPETIGVLEEMPVTANGKIDRKRLPVLKGVGRQEGQEYFAPRTPVEEILAGIYEELLELDRVGRDDNFFEVGGHSLLATQAISRVKKAFGVEIEIRRIFERPTVEGLAQRIEEAIKGGERDETPPLVKVSRAGREGMKLPLSFAQQRLWFLDQLMPNNPFYNIPGSVGLEGRLDLAALERVINEITRRHEALRTRIEVEAGEPVQVIDAPERRRLEIVDLTSLTWEEREEEANRILREEAETGFDLSRGPLLRVKVLKLEEERHALLYTMHHIVSDGWSMEILSREVGALYQAYIAGEEAPLEELEIQYADFAVWQRKYLTGKVLEREVSYWKNQLKDAAVMDLPTDYPRPASPSYRGGRERVWIGKELSEGLRRLNQREGTTLFMTLMAAFKTLLMRYSGEEDLSVGTPIANRTRKEIEGVIGFFVNTLVLRTDLSGNPSFRELLKREREVALEAYGRQEAPFEKLVEEINPDRDLSRSPLFQVMMALKNSGREEAELSEPMAREEEEKTRAVNFDLLLTLTEGREGIAGSLEYSQDLFNRETVKRMARHYVRVVEEIIKNAERRIGEIELMSETERDQIVVNWNRTVIEYPRELLIQELFEEQVEQRPESVAVVFEDQELSYRELNLRANQVAHHLRRLGVRTEATVGICMDRSLEMVIGLLGILKAGGSYLPLDPAYPAERLRFMLEDAAPLAVLTEERWLRDLPRFGAEIICLDRDWSLISNQIEENPAHQVRGENLAYIIYTSGSTGTPKGVAIGHRNAVNFIRWGRSVFDASALERTLFSTSLNFDLAVYECFVPLSVGSTIRVVRNALDLAGSPADITLINTVPSVIKALLDLGGVPRTVRTINLAGEPLNRDLVERIFMETEVDMVCNLYGPSETTTYSTWVAMKRLERFAAHIGRPIANTWIYILNERLQPSPVGARGEIHIGGAGVARGYLKRPEQTADRFVADPFGREPGARLYRTGDMGRWLTHGNIDFLGRADCQIKIRGFRVELGEIEAVLVSHPEVSEAVVSVHEDDENGKRLVAYYTGNEVGAEALSAHLSSRLPNYMVPIAYIRLENLPRTQNGKLNRRALPSPEGQAYISRSYEAPVGETEARLAQIWAETLKLERVGRHDNFFELGGHSLMVVILIERMRQQGLYTDVRTFYVTPTLAALASTVTAVSDIVQVPSTKIPNLKKKVRI
jgi:amino acid adenylation domain-containing protein